MSNEQSHFKIGMSNSVDNRSVVHYIETEALEVSVASQFYSDPIYVLFLGTLTFNILKYTPHNWPFMIPSAFTIYKTRICHPLGTDTSYHHDGKKN
jgi:hypothetical protein